MSADRVYGVRPRNSRRILLVVGLTIGLALVGSGSAGAGLPCGGGISDTAPDAAVKTSVRDTVIVGRKDYSDALARIRLGRGKSQIVNFGFKNRTSDTKHIRVSVLTQDVTDGIGLKYFADGENVSKRVRRGRDIVFLLVGPGQSAKGLDLMIRSKGDDRGSGLVRLQARFANGAPDACDTAGVTVNLAVPA